jgi:hypothetical protein
MLRITRGGREPGRHGWLTLAICRVLKRLFTSLKVNRGADEDERGNAHSWTDA